jgi:hypothetical protein
MERAMKVIHAALAVACAVPVAAAARITGISIERVEPFAEGMVLGAAGSYERVIGKARGELDPQQLQNKGIVNLDKVPRNARGLVEYETDFFMLRPVDAAKGNRKILYEVNNRGRKLLMHWILDAPQQAAGANNDPKSVQDAGNALVFRMGYTVVWSGWDPDAPRAGNSMAMAPVVPQADNAPIVRTIRDELVSGTRGPQVEAFSLNYEAASLNPAEAQLTMKRKEADHAVKIPAAQWTFVNSRTIRLLPEGTRPLPGALYELTYQAKNPKVLGIGFAATRDLLSFLRHEAKDGTGQPNPAGAGVRAVLGLGISQSGRYLRDFIGQGFNRDEADRKVFDAMLAHVSGIGRVFLNYEFGQPVRTNTQHEDHFYPQNAFPFSAAVQHDPVTGKRGALLRGDGFDPLLIEVNTSTEYWQMGASLLHTDPLGQRDVEMPSTARVYMIAGTQHGGRTGLSTAPGACANLKNPHSPAPALRALLVALDRWVSDGVAPPPSRVPRIADGTLVAPQMTGFPKLNNFVATPHTNAMVRFADWVDPKAEGGPQYRVLVSKVDTDGNEIGGIRLPDIAVPLATYTGWNLYKAPFPEGEMCDRDGSYLAFAKTRAERQAAGDPRLSVEERYSSQANYVGRVAAAAQNLVKERFLLPEDAERFVQKARLQNLVN